MFVCLFVSSWVFALNIEMGTMASYDYATNRTSIIPTNINDNITIFNHWDSHNKTKIVQYIFAWQWSETRRNFAMLKSDCVSWEQIC